MNTQIYNFIRKYFSLCYEYGTSNVYFCNKQSRI